MELASDLAIWKSIKVKREAPIPTSKSYMRVLLFCNTIFHSAGSPILIIFQQHYIRCEELNSLFSQDFKVLRPFNSDFLELFGKRKVNLPSSYLVYCFHVVKILYEIRQYPKNGNVRNAIWSSNVKATTHYFTDVYRPIHLYTHK